MRPLGRRSKSSHRVLIGAAALFIAQWDCQTFCVSGRDGWWSQKYPDELRERAVRMVLEIRRETGETHGVVSRVANDLGVGVESLRQWVNQAETDSGRRVGTTSADAQRIVQLERENKELRRANDILKAASIFFATELDGRPKR